MTEPPMERWRRLTLYLFLFGVVGITIELVLLEHMEELWQWTPLVLLAAGLALGTAVAVRPTRGLVATFRVLMLGYVSAAALGLYLHIQSNVEFELELRPTMSGMELAVESLKGAMPALAPGAMAQLGLLGLLFCFRHPALLGTGAKNDSP